MYNTDSQARTNWWTCYLRLSSIIHITPETYQLWCTIPWEKSVHFLPLIFRTTCLFDKRVVISRFHCSLAIQGIMIHISFPTYIQCIVLSTRNFIPNWFNKRTTLLQACTFIQSEAKTEPVKKRTNTKTQKAVISMPTLISLCHAFNRSQYNKCFTSFLPYIQYNVISKSKFSRELIQRQSLLFIQAFKVVQG